MRNTNDRAKDTSAQGKSIRSKPLMQAVGDWLFRGNRVYLLLAPNRMLKQRKIHWDRQSCDVEDEDGNLFYDVPWDDLEFWDDVEFHFPDDEYGSYYE